MEYNDYPLEKLRKDLEKTITSPAYLDALSKSFDFLEETAKQQL